MKIILTCGHPDSGYETVHTALVAAGVGAGQASSQESMSVPEFYAALYKAHDHDVSGPKTSDPITPGDTWQKLACDLFRSNASQNTWGWADARTVWLLEFWHDFDPLIRFVLVYSSLEFAVSHAFKHNPISPAEFDICIASWVKYNAEMLRFYNRHSDRCLLVNIQTTMQNPETWIAHTSEAFGVSLMTPIATGKIDGVAKSAVVTCLADGLFEECDEAVSLFRELESSASFEDQEASSLVPNYLLAWQEYSNLSSQFESVRKVATANADRANFLQEMVEHAMPDLDLSVEQFAASRSEGRDQTKLRTEWQSKNMAVAKSLAERIRVAEALHEQNEQLTKECDETHLHLTEQQRQLDQLTQQVESGIHALADAQSAIVPLQASNADLLQENDLLRLQLHFVEEELEHNFLQTQELSKSLELLKSTHECLSAERRCEVLLDMRNAIDGENWYYPEVDGRWAGPGSFGTIRVCPMRAGEYELRLDVVDTMSPEILAKMKVSLNGLPLALQTRLSNEGGKRSVRVYAKFSTGIVSDSPVWEFQFRFHQLISPTARGEDDDRMLAIRLQSLYIGPSNRSF